MAQVPKIDISLLCSLINLASLKQLIAASGSRMGEATPLYRVSIASRTEIAGPYPKTNPLDTGTWYKNAFQNAKLIIQIIRFVSYCVLEDK
jgi:hypothetical protein